MHPVQSDPFEIAARCALQVLSEGQVHRLPAHPGGHGQVTDRDVLMGMVVHVPDCGAQTGTASIRSRTIGSSMALLGKQRGGEGPGGAAQGEMAGPAVGWRRRP